MSSVESPEAEPLRVSILAQGPYLIASIHTALDDTQLARFQQNLIDRIGRDRTRGVIIDVAALDVLDSYGSHTLQDLGQVARLRGAETVVVGIQAEVAYAMVRFGIGLFGMHTALDLEEGLELLDGLTRPGSPAPGRTPAGYRRAR
jgi:rsbT antagonist protein RsbS